MEAPSQARLAVPLLWSVSTGNSQDLAQLSDLEQACFPDSLGDSVDLSSNR